MMEAFNDYAYYYNSFYKDKDYKAEAAAVDKLLKRYGGSVRNIINFGCGTGRHDIELAKLGYQCKGIDLSPLMIDIAKQNLLNRGGNIDFEIADVRDYTPQEKYDAVISLFHVMSYQTRNQDILSAFKTARNALNQGGIFLFDVWYGSGVLTDKPCVRVKELEDEENRLIRIAKPIMHENDNVVDVNYEVLVINKNTNKVQTIEEVHSMRYFFRPELDILLSLAGFSLIANVDCQTLADTDFGSWTSYFIAKAE